MSHTATIETQVRDGEALAEACRSLQLVPPTSETVTFYDGRQVTGTAVRLPGWRYPVVVQEGGALAFDDYNGAWGERAHLNALVQQYAVAVVRKTYGATHRIQQQLGADGRITMVLSR